MHRLVTAEFQKLTSTWLWLGLLVAAAAIAALYVSLQIAFTDTDGTWTLPLDTLAGQRTMLASASSAAAPLVAVLAAIGVAGEFRYRTATATFLATPRRERVIVAKLIAYGGVGLAFATVCLLVAIAIGWPWLRSDGIELQLTHPENLTTMLGVVIVGAVFALVGVGLGALIRDQVATVVGLLVYLFVLEPIVTGIGAFEVWTSYLPGPARSALTGTVLETRTFLEAWQGGLVLVGYALLLAVAGTVATSRRDVV